MKDNTPKPKGKKPSQPKQKPSQSARPFRKPSTAKEFQLDPDKSKPDPLLMKAVAFDVDDNLHGTQLYEHFGGDEKAKQYLNTRNGQRLLLGTIIRPSKKKRGNQKTSTTLHYDIQWEESDLGDTSVDVTLVIDAMALHQTIFSAKRSQRSSTRKLRNNDPFSPELRNLLFSVDDNEKGKPESSDEDDIDEEEEEEENFLFRPNSRQDSLNHCKSVPDDDDKEEFGAASDFCWSTGTLLPPPDRSTRSPSHVKPALTGNFTTPIQSLLAFIPLKIFNSIATFSNNYAHQVIERSENGHVCGRKWESDITINEIMKFFGILMKMVLRPTPLQSYPYCWNDPLWHPYTIYMPLRRFQQIRSVLHFNDNSNIEASNDAAFKVSSRVYDDTYDVH